MPTSNKRLTLRRKKPLHTFLLAFTTVTAISVGILLYSYIENTFGANISFLAGVIILTASASFINSKHW
jgi:hypothetical protein